MATLGSKPIRQCRGCELNLGACCAIFHHPSLKWKERQCEGYNNAFYIKHYETTLKADSARIQFAIPAKKSAPSSKTAGKSGKKGAATPSAKKTQPARRAR